MSSLDSISTQQRQPQPQSSQYSKGRSSSRKQGSRRSVRGPPTWNRERLQAAFAVANLDSDCPEFPEHGRRFVAIDYGAHNEVEDVFELEELLADTPAETEADLCTALEKPGAGGIVDLGTTLPLLDCRTGLTREIELPSKKPLVTGSKASKLPIRSKSFTERQPLKEPKSIALPSCLDIAASRKAMFNPPTYLMTPTSPTDSMIKTMGSPTDTTPVVKTFPFANSITRPASLLSLIEIPAARKALPSGLSFPLTPISPTDIINNSIGNPNITAPADKAIGLPKSTRTRTKGPQQRHSHRSACTACHPLTPRLTPPRDLERKSEDN